MIGMHERSSAETSAEPSGLWTDANGIQTHYLDVGEGDPVLLLHGSGPGVTAWSNWRSTIPSLSTTFRTIAPEYVGFGQTARPEGLVYGVETWTRHVLDFLDALLLDRVRIVGNSMGGAIALRIARYHPDRVSQMVLMGSGGLEPKQMSPGLRQLRDYEPTPENMRSLIADTFLYDSSLLTEQLVHERYESSRRPGVHETYRKMFHDAGHQGNEHWLPRDEIASVTTPTLVVHGREDRVIPWDVGQDLFHLLPNATLHMFSQCGHWAQIEHAGEFNTVVGEFFRSAPGTGEHGSDKGR
ncbi:alpha/beta fold hydrolase [Streptosporangium sp. NPDC006930]|uniref:alpha/beta fold hydrolase n=1 Tax=unclassified Streptosporangium TaxID=2632669 RepID=UPI00342F2C68